MLRYIVLRARVLVGSSHTSESMGMHTSPHAQNACAGINTIVYILLIIQAGMWDRPCN